MPGAQSPKRVRIALLPRKFQAAEPLSTARLPSTSERRFVQFAYRVGAGFAAKASAVKVLPRLAAKISELCGIAASVALMAACLVVCEMVFARYVLEVSTVWQTEFVLYAVVAATLIGSPYVLAMRGHVNVDLISQFLSPRGRLVLRVFSATLGLAFCLVLAFSGWRYFYEAWSNGWVTESVWGPPLWIVLLPLPLGVGLLCLQYCAEIIALFDKDPRSSTDDTVAPDGVDP